ncbi:MAG: preprotein translocase subunit SecY [Saprospiraceae bacterium]|nr:MAG: preprotein translocase subunit SecY [Saprospiraceae bacterium]
MKRLLTTLQNIWKIKELRERIGWTLLMLFIFRFGSFVVLPGVIPSALDNSASSSGSSDLLGLINTFTGGAWSNASVMALGIMPYITASIIIQLLGFAVPYFQRLQQKEGESGRKKLTQLTRLLTVAITLVQGGGYLTYINSIAGAIDPTMPTAIFWLSSTIILSAGTVFAMWLGERITDIGVGNGASLLITIGIIASLPQALAGEIALQIGAGGLFKLILEFAMFFVVIAAIILIIQGVRKVPIQFAKHMVQRAGTVMPAAGVRDYIPVKVNAAGVMPIIFAQALMFVPATIAQFAFGSNAMTAPSGLLRQLINPHSFTSTVFVFILVVAFTYVYTALIVNPTQYAEYLKRQNAFIPGVKPGKPTADFIDAITTRVTLPGSIFLGIIAILPSIAIAFGINAAFARFFGGTSILIGVGVVLDTLQQIESHLLMRRYDGLVKSGKLHGRSRMQTIGSGM